MAKINKRKIMKTAKKVVKQMGTDLNKSPLGRATKGKRTRGFN